MCLGTLFVVKKESFNAFVQVGIVESTLKTVQTTINDRFSRHCFTALYHHAFCTNWLEQIAAFSYCDMTLI